MLPEKQSKRKKKKKFPKKLKPPRSGRNINICEVKQKCDNNYRGSSQKNSGGGRAKIPPTTYGENGLYVERKDCPYRKIAP